MKDNEALHLLYMTCGFLPEQVGGVELHTLEIAHILRKKGIRVGFYTRGERAGLEEGALYPALRRLEKKGWIQGEWGESELGRRARFYSLTRKGGKALEVETARWQEHAAAVASILREAGS